MPVPTITIDQFGITVPTYEEILAGIKDDMRAIYGADLYLEADSQDGQFIGIFAEGINNAYQSALAVYNGYSPQTAQGTGLSNAVKINGLTRNVPTHSIVTLTVTGDPYTVIAAGIATDANNVRWILPVNIIIPVDGDVDVEATSEVAGAVQAPANTITIIGTPTRGWTTVNNAAAATPGNPAESDGELRARQRVSTEISSQALLTGMVGALLDVDAVTYVKAYENDTNSTDGNGIVAHAIALVIVGGLDADIGETIFAYKTPGCYTQGTTSYDVIDDAGLTNTMRWYRPTDIPIKIEVTLDSQTGYTTVIGDAIKQSLVDYIASLNSGDDIYWSRLFGPANLPGAEGQTYFITTIRLAIIPNAFGTANLTIAYNALASLSLANVTLIVV